MPQKGPYVQVHQVQIMLDTTLSWNPEAWCWGSASEQHLEELRACPAVTRLLIFVQGFFTGTAPGGIAAYCCVGSM